MNALAQTLLNLAFSITPRKERVWLEDMRYEAAFIDHPLPWSLSALGLALRWRLAHILATPSHLAFASVAMAAIATILILPNMLPNTKTAPANTAALPSPVTSNSETAEATDSYIDPSLSRSAEAQTVPSEDAEATAQYSEPVSPTLPIPSPAIEAEVPAAIPPTLPSVTENDLSNTQTNNETTGVVLGAIPTPVAEESIEENAVANSSQTTLEEPMGLSSSATAVAPEASADASATEEADIEAMIDAAVGQQKDESKAFEVNALKVSLKITKEVTLEVYQGTSSNDELLFSGTTKAATLTYDLPLFIKADDGSAIELYLSEDSRITLDDGEIQRIIKSIP